MAEEEVPWQTQLRSARGLSDEFLHCRLMKHGPWDFYEPTEEELKWNSWGTALGLKCTTCGMVRIEIVDSRGDISWRKYNPPEGYTIEKSKRPTVKALRVEWLKRKGLTRRRRPPKRLRNAA